MRSCGRVGPRLYVLESSEGVTKLSYPPHGFALLAPVSVRNSILPAPWASGKSCICRFHTEWMSQRVPRSTMREKSCRIEAYAKGIDCIAKGSVRLTHRGRSLRMGENHQSQIPTEGMHFDAYQQHVRAKIRNRQGAHQAVRPLSKPRLPGVGFHRRFQGFAVVSTDRLTRPKTNQRAGISRPVATISICASID